MSKLDTLYINFRKYCKENPTPHETKFYQLHLYEDGTGDMVLVDFCGTDDNPFRVVRRSIASWQTIPEGARETEKLLRKRNATTTDIESTGSTDSRDMAELSSAEESLQS